MEPISFAVGVVGLAGLFNACLETADRVSSYYSFKTDSQDLDAQFATDRLRFERWGRRVGFDAHGLAPDHDPALDDAATFQAVSGLLVTIKRILQDQADPDRSESLTDKLGLLNYSKSTETVKHRVSWALWTKKERIQQVGLFGTFVQKLHDVVPLDGGTKNDSFNGTAPWLDKLSQVTAQLERQVQGRTSYSCP